MSVNDGRIVSISEMGAWLADVCMQRHAHTCTHTRTQAYARAHTHDCIRVEAQRKELRKEFKMLRSCAQVDMTRKPLGQKRQGAVHPPPRGGDAALCVRAVLARQSRVYRIRFNGLRFMI